MRERVDGTARLLALLTGLALVGAAWRGRPAALDGVPIEVRGDVARPGWYLVDPSLRAAIAAAGGRYDGPDRAVALGDRVVVGVDGVRVDRSSDPVLIGAPLDPAHADLDALLAVPGLRRADAEAIVAGRPWDDLPADARARLRPYVERR